MRETVDIDEVFSEPKVEAVLDVWWDARAFEAPAFSGGVRDAWPALMVDGLALCEAEERAIRDFRQWADLEVSRG